MFTVEDIRNTLEDDVRKLWNFHSEQWKLENSLLEGHLMLLQLNALHHLLRI